ncbi:MAG: hypothetical protein K5650_03430 [Bacteroidales bacterium]|nr:hypothetical protein [Bacteroidales bacterium]
MKKLSILLVCVAALAFTSCSMMQTSSNSAAALAGRNCGAAVASLYKVYNTNKTIDLTNTTNLTNALALTASCSQLKENKDNAAYKRDFAAGVVSSAAGLVTTQTAMSFVDKILATSGLDNVNASSIANTASTAMAIYSILNSVKQQ